MTERRRAYIGERTVRAENGCLIWQLKCDSKHYPTGWCDGEFRVGRWLWEQENGPVPPGLLLLHSCDDLRCVEHTHLSPGTHAQNRAEFMERNPRAREIVASAIRKAGEGSKRHWDRMTPEERAEFSRRRARIQKEKRA